MKNCYDEVKAILTKYPQTRDDDMLLYGQYLFQSQKVGKEETFFKVLASATKRNLPSYESITRARRKVQEKEPSLRGKKYGQRKKTEQEYHDYYMSH